MTKSFNHLFDVDTEEGQEINVYSDGDVVIHFYNDSIRTSEHVIVTIDVMREIVEKWDNACEMERQAQYVDPSDKLVWADFDKEDE